MVAVASPCVCCAAPADPAHEFCVHCGWPLRQPSPYEAGPKVLPVCDVTRAPYRDPAGRALSYHSDPRSGRAYMPGQHEGAIDKIPDYPSGEGPGNRRGGEVLSGQGVPGGTYTDGGRPRGVGLGAGRIVWVDDRDLFSWNLQDPKPTRTSHSGLMLTRQAGLVTNGWRTYMATARGLVVHDGLAGTLTIAAPGSFDFATRWRDGVAAAGGRAIALVARDGSKTEETVPFSIAGLASEGDILAAFGHDGSAWLRDGTTWRALLSGEPNGLFEQGWIVNERVGVRYRDREAHLVRYGPRTAGLASPPALTVDSDLPLSVVPSPKGWEYHRLIGFVGGGTPRVTSYAPGEGNATFDPLMLSSAAKWSPLAVVRRGADGAGSILLTFVDVQDRVVFVSLRRNALTLPGAHPLSAGADGAWLIPHPHGVALVTSDISRVILNNIPLP